MDLATMVSHSVTPGRSHVIASGLTANRDVRNHRCCLTRSRGERGELKKWPNLSRACCAASLIARPWWPVWTAGHEIKIGDLLLVADGEQTSVEATDGPKESAPVYNLEIAEYHTYFGGGETWGFSVLAQNYTNINPGDVAAVAPRAGLRLNNELASGSQSVPTAEGKR